ncbi:MAG: hypothetical protein RLZZ450_1511 [Pseudomonadota bacterium]|jgi:hypothetical protein
MRAQDDSTEVPGYRAAIDETLAEYTAQNYLEAMTLFARAHQLSPNARTLRGLGVVTFELRRYSESVSFLEQALSSAKKRLDGTMRSETVDLLARARGFVAKIEITLEPSSGTVLVDGETASLAADRRLLLDIGKHQLEFSAAGYLAQRRSFTVVGGEEQNWKVSLRTEDLDGVPPLAATSTPPLLRWHKALGATAIGLGVAGIVTAGIFTAQRHDDGIRFRGTVEGEGEYPRALQAWEDSRAKPYAFASAGAIALTSGAMGLVLRAPRSRYVVLAAGVSALAGLALVGWGIADMIRGGPCEATAPDRQACSDDLERKDRGAVTLVSAFPLVATPIALLFRGWLGHSSAGTVSVRSGFDPKKSSVLFNVRVAWL